MAAQCYATLIVGRAKFEAIDVATAEGQKRFDRSEAEDHHQTLIAPARARHLAELESARAKRAEYIAAADVHTDVEYLRDTGGLRRSRERVDVVVLDGKPQEVPLGTAHDFLKARATVLFPDPAGPADLDFNRWFKAGAKTVKTWIAELVTESGSTAVELGAPEYWSWWAFPVPQVNAQLNRLSREGWLVVQVSEDHGLFQGQTAGTESAPIRVRYLLRSS